MPYQDRWICGTVRGRGDRECAARYEAIRTIVSAYQRQITVWDLGANLGYFGCRLADEFGCVSAMVESRQALADTVRANALPTTLAMTHRLSVEDLRQLSRCEHADVVLALNVLHHIEDSLGALDAVTRLGEVTIIETPGRGDVGSAHYARSQVLLDVIEGMTPDLIGWAPSHVSGGVCRPIYAIRREKSELAAGYLYGGRVRARGPHPPRPHRIVSTPKEKTITYHNGTTRPFVPGINLWNWLQLGGSYPSRSDVRACVRAAADGLADPHGDLRPWNVILRGESVTIIDGGHRRSVADDRGLADTLAWIDRPELAYVA